MSTGVRFSIDRTSRWYFASPVPIIHRDLCGTPRFFQVLSEHLVAKLNQESAEIFRPPKPGNEADWASSLPFPLMAVLCESDAGLANAGKLWFTALCHGASCEVFSLL